MERLPGFRDFFPEPLPSSEKWSCQVREYIFEAWRTVAQRYGFREYDGPPLEELQLFTTKSGEEIVRQLYNFKDKGEDEIALRPEMTPTLARMVAAVERNYKKPLKWFAIPQLFRYERQQKGRLREHFQLNCDIIGESGVGADAELIGLLIDSLRALKLTEDDFVVRLSSRKAWQEFFEKRCTDGTKAYAFFQIIDKLGRTEPAVSAAALETLGFSHGEILEFIERGEGTAELRQVMEDLNARGLGGYVKIDYGIIRGLAYYTGVVFEVFDRKGEMRAIAGGGRYDNLLKVISEGRVDLPSAGFGMGDVVLFELLQERGLVPKFNQQVDLYCMIGDESRRLASLRIVQSLREAGFFVDYPLAAAKEDKQFKRAVELGARFIVKLEEEGVRIRDLQLREEKSLAQTEAVEYLSARGARRGAGAAHPS